MLTQENAFKMGFHTLYGKVMEDETLPKKAIRRKNPLVGLTIHPGEIEDYAVLVNYSDQPQAAQFEVDSTCYHSVTALYGNAEQLEPFGAAVFKLTK